MNTAVTTTADRPVLPMGAPAAAATTITLLSRLNHGQLTVQFPDGSVQRFGGSSGPSAAMRLHNWNVCAAALKSGDIGLAESYVAGDWTTPQLSDLLRLFLVNREAMDTVIYGSWWGRLAYRLRHLLNRNTRSNSQKNIHAHYDLGNGFYRLWLDPTMNYSSAWFAEPGMDLVAAQHAKVERALQMVGAKAGDRVLEIGCGWGALAEAATVRHGAHVVGVTLSTEQLDWARERMAKLGVTAQADLRLQDYRDIGVTIPDEPFDAICSIEMLEAVGQAYWPTYFGAVERLLKPGGRACIQTIVIDDALFDRYIRGTDFIQQYIFPGGCLPSPQRVREQAQAAGLEVVDEMAFGPDYAETLRQWRDRFLSQHEAVLEQGFDQRFLRIWEFYLAYCEAGFDHGSINVMQFTLAKPGGGLG